MRYLLLIPLPSILTFAALVWRAFRRQIYRAVKAAARVVLSPVTSAIARAKERQHVEDCWQDQLWLDEQTQERSRPAAEMCAYDFTGGEHA